MADRNNRRFLWEIVWVVLAILGAAYFMKGASVTFAFDDVMRRLNVHDTERYIRLAVLGLIGIAIVACVRVFRR